MVVNKDKTAAKNNILHQPMKSIYHHWLMDHEHLLDPFHDAFLPGCGVYFAALSQEGQQNILGEYRRISLINVAPKDLLLNQFAREKVNFGSQLLTFTPTFTRFCCKIQYFFQKLNFRTQHLTSKI